MRQVYVVIDHGDVSSRSRGIVDGVYDERDDAESRADEINGPFKGVSVSQTTYYGGDD